MIRALAPKLIVKPAGAVGVIFRAGAYESLQASEGWQDFNAILLKFKDELTSDLTTGVFSDNRQPGVTDEQLQGMLWLLNRILSVPAEAKIKYDMLRRAEEEVSKAQDRLDRYRIS